MTRRLLLDESGQMAVEMAALIPVVVVVALTVFNLGRFVCACAVFDRVAYDAVVSQGISAQGAQTDIVAVDAVQRCIEDAMGDSKTCKVEVSAQRVGHSRVLGRLSFVPSLVEFECTLGFRPWPGRFVLAGVAYDSPLLLRHSRSLVVDKYSPGVVR